MDSKKIGSLLLQLRTEKHFTQKQLADKLNVSDKTVSKWERAAGCPDITLLPALSRIFGVDIEQLLLGELNPKETDGGNMKHIQFYRCPSCGNVISATSAADVSCCGRKLVALTPTKADELHAVTTQDTDDETYVTLAHPMTKEHYIAFAAYVSFDAVYLVRLYPEQECAFRLPRAKRGTLYVYCVNDGLFVY